MTPFFNSPSVFPNSIDGSSSQIDAFGSREPGQPYLAVTLLSARNIPLSDDSSTNFEFISGLYYMYCDLWLSPLKGERMRSSKQPRTQNPVFRDELSFSVLGVHEEIEPSNIYRSKSTPTLVDPKSSADILTAAGKLSLHCSMYNHKPLAFGDDELIGVLVVPIKIFGFSSLPSEPIYEWVSLLDAKGDPLENDAAVRLKVQLLN